MRTLSHMQPPELPNPSSLAVLSEHVRRGREVMRAVAAMRLVDHDAEAMLAALIADGVIIEHDTPVSVLAPLQAPRTYTARAVVLWWASMPLDVLQAAIR